MMKNEKKNEKKKKSIVLEVQNVKGILKIDSIGGRKNGKDRT